ncbi:Mce protein [Mycobacterium sp. IS-2888]|uniref:Mce protein n=1 Tax=unclassified Mycobacterium TaxID=2642494 RepID=UPI00096D32A7|nr:MULTISPECIES: Mce protein [unclassified Mycobacterium]OMC38354.1 Mce protein [Mycobacterium sp. IS-1264]OMC52573.1 Mce protein [Mycobacterium sp. IS-2888]
MEGDAGAGRLNPPPMPIARRLRRLSLRPGRKNRQDSEVEADQSSTDETSAEVTAEDSPESEADETSDEVTAAAEPETADVAEPEGEAEQLGAEVTTEDSEESEDAAVEGGDAAAERRPSRLGRGWVAGIAAALVLAAGGIGAGGYLALRYHHDSQVIARNNAAALKAAVDCVSATQAPDTNAMVASEQKIIDCGTDAFRAQALLYTSMLVQAYQASNIHVQVADVRAAVERNNKDGSIDVLVAMRVKVASDKSENETGYRLRVTMATAEGQYRIAKLDQVTK